MNWKEVREKYKDTWVLVEELESESIDSKRILLDMVVINYYDDGAEALKEYKILHKNDKKRILYVCYTKHEELIIKERKWKGVNFIK